MMKRKKFALGYCVIAFELRTGDVLFQDCLEVHVDRAKRWAREDGRRVVAVIRDKRAIRNRIAT